MYDGFDSGSDSDCDGFVLTSGPEEKGNIDDVSLV